MVTAFIKIWNKTAGAVYWDDGRRMAIFDPKFVSDGYDLSPLKMPRNSSKLIFSFPELAQQNNTFKGLPGLLADALPDRFGNQLINAWLAQNGRPENSMNPIEQLCFTGLRGMGALEFEPAYFKGNKNTSQIELNSLVDIAQKMLHKREEFESNLTPDDQKAVKDILKIELQQVAPAPRPSLHGTRRPDKSVQGRQRHLWVLNTG